MQRRRRTGTRTRRGPVTRNEFDIQMAYFSALTKERYEAEAELRRQWIDSYERRDAERNTAYEQRRAKERADDEQRAAEFRAMLAEGKAENDRKHQEHRDEMAELRKDFRSLKWNIWMAACGTIIGLASLNSAMSSNILSAYESGRNAAVTRVTPWHILFGFERKPIDEARPGLP